MKRWMFTMAALVMAALSAFAQNWPGWRGPTADGVVAEKGFPTKWSATENIAWKTPIPGRGHSSPIVWGERVFVTSCVEGPDAKDKSTPRDRILVCLDRKDGQIIWQKTVLTAKLEGLHRENSFASSTPATDGALVYVTFFDQPKVIVAALDFEGNEVWRKSPGDFQSVHGFSSPPILYKDLVIVNCDQDAEKKKNPAYIVAFDKKTGDERWRIDRPNRIRSYTPPYIVEAAGRTQMVLTGCMTVASYDPDTGKPIWNIDGPTEQFVASMIFHKGHFYLTAGFPTYHVMCVKPDGTGNVSEKLIVDKSTKPPTEKPNPNSRVVWHEKVGAGYVPSPVAAGDNIFLVHDDGRASCRDALTGKLHWLERLGKHYHASPVVADGRVYYMDDDGNTYIVKASSEFELLGTNELKESVFSSPAFSKGQILIRAKDHLYCVGAARPR
jgi:hypothetical protein